MSWQRARFNSFNTKTGFDDALLADTVFATLRSGFRPIREFSLAGLAFGATSKLGTLHPKALTAIVLSGIAGAVSWLFYFKAIQVGSVSQVAPIDKLSMPLAIVLAVVILGDRPTRVNWFGIALIVGGAYLAKLPRGQN